MPMPPNTLDTLDTLEAEVLRLPAAARSHLLDRLIRSLDADRGIDEAWAQEARRRDSEIDSGVEELIPAEAVIEKLRAALT